jgi:hypothetical protein
MSRLKRTMVAGFMLALCSMPAQAQYPRIISFSGYNWSVKTSTGKVGPGPNHFSDSTNNVWVDAQGRLHLKILKSRGHWYCSEVILQASLGYGTYRFYLDSAVDALDPNVVLGLFTWNDAPDYNHREIDIEMSRWGQVNNLNAQYVVQPYTLPQNIFRWQEPAGLPQSTHSFNWQVSSVFFQALKGLNATPPDPSYIIQQDTLSNGIPVPGGENARINLWLNNGSAPTNGQSLEIIINRFEFVP